MFGGVIDVVYGWLDRRLPFTRTLNRVLKDPVPERGGWWYTLGAAIFVLLTIQIITGIFLMFYYVPSWNEARDSILYIQQQVFLGWLVRGIHYWNQVALVFLVGAHMARTFFSAAYKAPRELIWVLGVTLLLLMVGTAFTGGILRWDQSGYFDVVVGTTIAGWTPIIGPGLAQLWRGGDTITPLTLTRTFVFHVWLLPAPLFLLAVIHVGLVVVQGQYGSWVNYEQEPPDAHPMDEDEIASREKAKRELLDPESHKVNLPVRTTWFFPYHVFKEGIVSGVMFLGVFLAACFFAVPVEEAVDPSTTTYAPSSMWFWLFLDQMFLIFPGAWMIPFGVIAAPAIIVTIFYLLPWLDRNPGLKPYHRPVAVTFMVVIIMSILVLAMLGASRVYNYDFVNTPG
ncbi:MAG TPA: cytochrome bc complex cytochrome b subunit [Chloroflexota bacterium]|nr:cytochrome bc complex cytochrome b subunit [Chloroflexota bacterium]